MKRDMWSKKKKALGNEQCRAFSPVTGNCYYLDNILLVRGLIQRMVQRDNYSNQEWLVPPQSLCRASKAPS